MRKIFGGIIFLCVIFLLFGCGSSGSSGGGGTPAAQTITATEPTATLTPTPSPTQTKTFQYKKITQMWERQPDSNAFGYKEIAIGTNQNGMALFEFDVTSIPTTSTIKSAKVTVVVRAANYSPANLRYCLSGWNDATVYNTMPSVSAVVKTVQFPHSAGLMEIDIADMVKYWVNEGNFNYGFEIENGLHYDHDHVVLLEGIETVDKPYLVVVYQ